MDGWMDGWPGKRVIARSKSSTTTTVQDDMHDHRQQTDIIIADHHHHHHHHGMYDGIAIKKGSKQLGRGAPKTRRPSTHTHTRDSLFPQYVFLIYFSVCLLLVEMLSWLQFATFKHIFC